MVNKFFSKENIHGLSSYSVSYSSEFSSEKKWTSLPRTLFSSYSKTQEALSKFRLLQYVQVLLFFFES